MRTAAFCIGIVLCLAAAVTAQPLKTVVAVVEPDKSAEALAGCSFGCATEWSTRVSSSLAPQGVTRYDATQVEDLDEKTAWASRGKGEYLEAVFKGNGKNWQAPLTGFRIINGYAKSSDLWKKNARVKTLRLDYNGRPQALIRLHDSANVQSVSIPNLTIRPGDRVRLTIVDVYPGTKYPDTCVSEIIFDGAH